MRHTRTGTARHRWTSRCEARSAPRCPHRRGPAPPFQGPVLARPRSRRKPGMRRTGRRSRGVGTRRERFGVAGPVVVPSVLPCEVVARSYDALYLATIIETLSAAPLTSADYGSPRNLG